MSKETSRMNRFTPRNRLPRRLALIGLAAIASVATAAPSAQAACPNEAIRAQQHATQLAHCRAWERVSPADKGDGDIIAEGLSTTASEAGDAAAFESRLNFGDSLGSAMVGRTTYLARRGAGGWSTHSVSPLPRPDAVQVLYASTQMEVFSEDLSTALLWAYDLPAVSDDTPLRENLYVEDTTTNALRTISKTQQDELALFDFLNPDYRGVSADAKHVAFVTATRMLPEAEPTVENIYKWDDGALSVAGVLPDGSLPPNGSTSANGLVNMKGLMSADGTRLAFSASPDGSAPSQLYLHVDGRPSVWVSEPERGDHDLTPPNGIHFEGMTPDGNSVFFISDDPLLDEDTAPGPDLYRFTYSADAASDGNLTLITNNGASAFNPGLGNPLVGMSDDATRVYVHQIDGGPKLWQEGVPGLTIVDPSSFIIPQVVRRLTLLASEPGHGRVSPDGDWFAYINQDGQMYLYGLRDQSLTCVSCPSGASVVPTVTNSGGRSLKGFRPRFLSDDGQVFFTSTGSLLPEDTNGVADVYEYDGPAGKLSLLTSGKGSDPSMFTDAGSSGDDVFFVTRQQLASSDRDEYVDLYDARAGGGFDEPESSPTAPCAGDSCQVAASGPAAAPAIRSGAATRGNVKQRRHHKANKHHKHHKRQHRTAGTNRRASK